MSSILQGAYKTLHLPANYLYSLRHHLTLGKRVQTVFVLYLMLLVCLAHYRQYVNTQMTTIASFVIIGVLLIVLLYQSYYLLNRIRSFFLPLIITYVFRLVQQAEDKQIKVPYGNLIKQLAVVVVFVYLGHMTYSFNRDANKMNYKIYNACTVFDIIGTDKHKVQQKQLKQAELWWKYDFKRGLKKNKVTSL
jgi:amino acid transporter